MASSQVEISSSAAFGCVLRDHNRRGRCRESNARVSHGAFQKNLKSLVDNCMSISSSSGSNETFQSEMNAGNCFVRSLESSNLSNLQFSNDNHNFSINERGNSSTMGAAQAGITVQQFTKRKQETAFSAQNNSPLASPSVTIPGKTGSLSRSETFEELENLGASSLVQIWEKRLNQFNNMNINMNLDPNLSPCGFDSISESSYACSADAGDSADESNETGTCNGDACASWRSSGPTPQSPQSSSQGRSFDVGESERVRVADIIRRLTASPFSPGREDSSQFTFESPSRDSAEHRCFSKAICSPRIRGRQAFTDLLMQQERDRHRELDRLVERRAVSKFSQRGRIQSLLRLRLLQRGMAASLNPSNTRSTASETSRAPQGSAILHQRKRFNTGCENSTQAPSDASITKSPCGETNSTVNQESNTILESHGSNREDGGCENFDSTLLDGTDRRSSNGESKSSTNLEVCSTSSQEIGRNHQGNVGSSDQRCEIHSPKSLVFLTPEDLQEVSSPSSQGAWEETILETVTIDPQEMADTTLSVDRWDYDVMTEEHEIDDQPYVSEASYDWFSDISRPRSYWEDRRQEWYQEMLNTDSAKEEIRQLLQRRTVSNFLCSDFREIMDRMIACRLSRQTRREERDDDNEERVEQMLSSLQRHVHLEDSHEEEEDKRDETEEEEEQEEKEEERLTVEEHTGTRDCFRESESSLPLPSPSLVRSWDKEGDVSCRVASMSSPQLPPSQASFQESPQSSPSTFQPSLEMELVLDLRSRMELLYQEMAELKKSLRSCMLQQATRNELDSVSGMVKKGNEETSRKRKCCICYELEVDSFLYRCGHMCTCLKCAHELQWGSGKCPICRAPIVDVVRAFAES